MRWQRPRACRCLNGVGCSYSLYHLFGAGTSVGLQLKAIRDKVGNFLHMHQVSSHAVHDSHSAAGPTRCPPAIYMAVQRAIWQPTIITRRACYINAIASLTLNLPVGIPRVSPPSDTLHASGARQLQSPCMHVVLDDLSWQISRQRSASDLYVL